MQELATLFREIDFPFFIYFCQLSMGYKYHKHFCGFPFIYLSSFIYRLFIYIFFFRTEIHDILLNHFNCREISIKSIILINVL